jgi:accessory gene regulator protein AgrB
VYVWIWRRLPGNRAAKALGCLVLFLAVVALLFFVVFPWIEPRLPWNDVTVDGSGAMGPLRLLR